MDRALEKTKQDKQWLRDSMVAEAVVASLRRGETLGHYELSAFVVMPNHVHILIEPQISVVRLLKALKGSTARAANLILKRPGEAFWQDESFDHWVRSATEWERIREYIEMNPVKAGLVRRREDWLWSSAAQRKETPRIG